MLAFRSIVLLLAATLPGCHMEAQTKPAASDSLQALDFLVATWTATTNGGAAGVTASARIGKGE